MQFLLDMAERGWLPDPLIRMGIRRLTAQRLTEEDRGNPEAQAAAFASLLKTLADSPVAVSTDDANTQHYEVPPELFELMLGPHLKYSCCYWLDRSDTLEDAEVAMLELTCDRAQLEDGQRILELGCGWGSLTLWMAAHYPHAHITAVSNSHAQRQFIEARCAAANLSNVTVVTADMNDFAPEGTFDRVVSIEMFEHMRNYRELMHRIASWLDTDGSLFVHIFCHKRFAYLYEPSGPNDWMAREFFTGGTMPSDDLLLHFQEDLSIDEHWRASGSQYVRTLETWLDRIDAHRERALAVFLKDLSPAEAARQLQRWRLFLMACSELFAYRGGNEWWVSHYRFRKR